MNRALNYNGFQYLYFLQDWLDNRLKLRQSADEGLNVASDSEIPDFLKNATDEELNYLADSSSKFRTAVENALQSKTPFADNLDKLANQSKEYLQVIGYFIDKYKPDFENLSDDIEQLQQEVKSKLANHLSISLYETVKESLKSISKIYQADFDILGLKDDYYTKRNNINSKVSNIYERDITIYLKLFIDNFDTPIYKWSASAFSLFTLSEYYGKYGSDKIVREICEALIDNANSYFENTQILSYILDLYEHGEKGLREAEKFIKLRATNSTRFKNVIGENTKTLIELIEESENEWRKEVSSIKNINEITKYTQLTTNDLSNILSVSEEKLEERGLLESNEHLTKLLGVYARGYDMFERSDFQHWLKHPNLTLDGKIPFDLLHTSVGLEEVSNTIGRIEHGIPF